MIITIDGDIGSGKTTVAKELARRLVYQFYSVGQLRRDAAERRGMTLLEYDHYGETHPETDYEVDEQQKKLGEQKDHFVITGRVSFAMIPQAKHIYLAVHPEEAARRIWKDLAEGRRKEEGSFHSESEVLKYVNERAKSEALRYQKYYPNIRLKDPKNFDLWLDTTSVPFEEVVRQVEAFVRASK